MTIRPALFLLALALAHSLPAQAERADRNKPMHLEANKITIDDAHKTQVLEGDVILSKGSLLIKAERLVLTEDAQGFQKGVAYSGRGKLASFRQKREGRDEYLEGEAVRVEYNSNNEVAEFFQRARVNSGQDEVKGEYIWYDAISEKYLVSAGEQRTANAPNQRVRAVIQPRQKEAAVPASAAPAERLELRGVNRLEADGRSN